MAAVVVSDLLVGRRRISRHPAELDRIGVGSAGEYRRRVSGLGRNDVSQDDEHGGQEHASHWTQTQSAANGTIGWIHDFPLPVFESQAYPAARPDHAP